MPRVEFKVKEIVAMYGRGCGLCGAPQEECKEVREKLIKALEAVNVESSQITKVFLQMSCDNSERYPRQGIDYGD